MLYLYDERSALTRTVPLREFFAIQPDHLAIQCALSALGKKVACTDPLSSAILIHECLQQQVYAFVDPVGHEIVKERLPDCFLKEAAAFASAEADESGTSKIGRASCRERV